MRRRSFLQLLTAAPILGPVAARAMAAAPQAQPAVARTTERLAAAAEPVVEKAAPYTERELENLSRYGMRLAPESTAEIELVVERRSQIPDLGAIVRVENEVIGSLTGVVDRLEVTMPYRSFGVARLQLLCDPEAIKVLGRGAALDVSAMVRNLAFARWG